MKINQAKMNSYNFPTIWHNCSYDVTMRKNAFKYNFNINQAASEKEK